MEDTEHKIEEENKQSNGNVISETKMKREEILKNHIEEMKKEISEWKHTYHTVKAKYDELKKFSNDVILDWAQCKDYLTEEDMAFLNARPNYDELPKKLESVAARVEITKHQLDVKKAQQNARMIIEKDAIQNHKKRICQLLMDFDESLNFFSFNDNCGIDVQLEEGI